MMLRPPAPSRTDRRPMPLFLAPLLCCALLGCGSDDVPPDPPYTADCDPLMGPGMPCSMPWPSSLYLKEDASRKTGYALRFGAASLPATQQGAAILPGPYNKLDGYSVGTPLLVIFPNVNASQMASEDHIERSLDPAAPVLWFEDSGGTVKPVPYWVELDGTELDPTLQTLIVRPAKILKEGTRYVVAFRGLRDRMGAAIAPSRAFQRLRDGQSGSVPLLAARQARFDKVFATLEAQGVKRDGLTLAWDFVTDSNEAVHGDLLRMRDDALTQAGTMGPAFSDIKVTTYVKVADGGTHEVDANIALQVEGSFEVPNYLAPLELPGFSGSQLNRDGAGKVQANGTRKSHFWVRIPYSALTGTPHGLVIYGHGLLGSGDQVRSDFNGKIANDHNLIFFAADLTGMAEDDQGPVIKILQDLGRFSSLADRLHQGMIEWVLLARGMRERLQTVPEVAAMSIKVNRDELFYSGISQGGIFGGTFVALSPDIVRGHLGVPGSNYSTLLQRSTDFKSFFGVVSSVYPASADQLLALSAMQLLWDATDPVTHYRHLSVEPYPGNAAHHVLLAPARGDNQVAPVTNEVLARSGLDVALMEHYDDDRMPYGVTPTPYPYTGSGIVLWHFGNPWPTPGNHPPMADQAGDPHEKPRRRDSHNEQMVHFFRTGMIEDVCGGQSCWPDGRP